MALSGTVVNGVIVLDGSAALPEGARVRVELGDEEAANFSQPPAETNEVHLDILRESLEEAKAGRTRPARDVLREIALRHNLPLETGE